MREFFSKRIVCAALGACLVALAPIPQAEAACTQADVTGTWYIMGFSVNTDNAGVEWDRCKVRTNSAGAIVTSGSSCIFRYNGGKYPAAVSGGAIRVGSGCGVTGTTRVCMAGGGCATLKIEYGQLDRGKTVMSLVGNMVGSPATIYSFTGIKQ